VLIKKHEPNGTPFDETNVLYEVANDCKRDLQGVTKLVTQN